MSETQVTPMSLDDFECDLDELESAEDFLTYFGVAFDPAVVHVNRLHILQRFHDYLAKVEQEPDNAPARVALYTELMRCAYQDFVDSNALTEKVFRVFHMHEPPRAEISLNDLMSQLPPKSTAAADARIDPDAS